jgi:xanthine dehydrogenase YagR molybdenum-binding subunit
MFLEVGPTTVLHPFQILDGRDLPPAPGAMFERGRLDHFAFSQRMLREAFTVGAERFGWSQRTPQPRSLRDGRWLVGMGVATAFHTALRTTANVAVRLAADSTALVRCGFHEMGMGTATAQAQIAADSLGVPFDAVRVEYGDATRVFPPDRWRATSSAD